jgi:hypothetical protein
MQVSKGLLLVCLAGALAAQTVEDPQVTQARLALEKVRALVTMGSLPRSELQKSEGALADAQDAAILRREIYQQDLTEAQADELVAAAERQFARRKDAFDRAKKLVEDGLAPRLSLDTYLTELDFARKECDLAESRARLSRELAQQAEAEAAATAARQNQTSGPGLKTAERFDGNGLFTQATLHRVEAAFEARFGKPLPVSALGETAVHRALGFDHRGRVDVALHPDQAEGVWLREYLTENKIPFFAFRQAVAGKATGAHIHMGPMSSRLAAGD